MTVSPFTLLAIVVATVKTEVMARQVKHVWDAMMASRNFNCLPIVKMHDHSGDASGDINKARLLLCRCL